MFHPTMIRWLIFLRSRRAEFLSILLCFGFLKVSEGKEVLRFPPHSPDNSEAQIDVADVAKLPMTKSVRDLISDRKEVVTESEKVTLSKEFGYIFRYDILDENSIATNYKNHSTFVVWSIDGVNLCISSSSGFGLPSQFD